MSSAVNEVLLHKLDDDVERKQVFVFAAAYLKDVVYQRDVEAPLTQDQRLMLARVIVILEAAGGIKNLKNRLKAYLECVGKKVRPPPMSPEDPPKKAG